MCLRACTETSDSRGTQPSRSLKHGCSAVTEPIFLQHPPFLLTQCYVTNSCEQNSRSPQQPCVHTSKAPVQNQRLTPKPSPHSTMLGQEAKHWLGKEHHVCKESGSSLCLSCSLLCCFTIHNQNLDDLNSFPGTPTQQKEATASRELILFISRPDTSFHFLYPKPNGHTSI